tara:strand:- start:145 stop:360 length:216 start_codon:yes stop_codon:yes gene_type:complete
LVQVVFQVQITELKEQTQNFTHHHITLTLLHSLFVVQVEVVVETLLPLLDLLAVDLVEVNLHKHLLEVVMQ